MPSVYFRTLAKIVAQHPVIVQRFYVFIAKLVHGMRLRRNTVPAILGRTSLMYNPSSKQPDNLLTSDLLPPNLFPK